MVDEGNPNCDHRYPRGGEWCAICGRYRHTDQVKALVAKAPPLSRQALTNLAIFPAVRGGNAAALPGSDERSRRAAEPAARIPRLTA